MEKKKTGKTSRKEKRQEDAAEKKYSMRSRRGTSSQEVTGERLTGGRESREGQGVKKSDQGLCYASAEIKPKRERKK